MTSTSTKPSARDEAYRLKAAGQYKDALLYFDKARLTEPMPSVFIDMAETLSLLSMKEGAEKVLREGWRCFPNDLSLIEALGSFYYQNDACARGLIILQSVFENADSDDLVFLQATLQKGAGHADKAKSLFEKLCEKNPHHIAALSNLAGLWADQGESEKAVALYKKALARAPQHPHIRAQLAQILLRKGDLAEGFAYHEARFEQGGHVKPRPFTQAPWNGKKGDGGLLLWNEQGVGEEILYASLLNDVKALCGRLYVECDARLLPLFARSFQGIHFVARQEPPAPTLFEKNIIAQCAAGSAAAFLRKGMDDFNHGHGYLLADKEKTKALRTKYENIKKEKGLTGKLIGVSWRSKPLRLGDPKSTALSDWGTLMDSSPHLFVSLQYQATRDDFAFAASRQWNVIEDSDIDQAHALDDFAAQIAALDGVVSVSNTTAHMAGALGLPVAVLLPRSKGLMWHWFEKGERSPWYASARLIRQSMDGNWSDALHDAAAFIRAL